MTLFTEMVIDTIKNIPKGKVMTYGGIANNCGSPKAARQVVRILHTMTEKYNLPWHRVVNSKGEIGFKDTIAYEHQRALLESEGIEFKLNGTINLSLYEYHGGQV